MTPQVYLPLLVSSLSVHQRWTDCCSSNTAQHGSQESQQDMPKTRGEANTCNQQNSYIIFPYMHVGNTHSIHCTSPLSYWENISALVEAHLHTARAVLPGCTTACAIAAATNKQAIQTKLGSLPPNSLHTCMFCSGRRHRLHTCECIHSIHSTHPTTHCLQRSPETKE